MAIVAQELLSICRFCLCQEEKQLLPITKIIHPSLTIEDVRRFTGIQLHRNDALRLVMCLECFDSLRRSADFRNACIRNEPTFHQMCIGPSTSDNHGLAKNTQDVDPLEVQIEVLRVETELFDEDTFVNGNQNTSTVPSHQEIATKNNDQYSANCIAINEPPAERLTVRQAPDSEKETPHDDDFTWHESETDPARDGKQKLVRKKRPNRKRAGAEQIKRRDPAREAKSSSTGGRSTRVLCSICGTFVSNLIFHQNYHHAKTSIKLSCPHCPAKITHQKNLTRHINTVHLKIVEKTCKICGKEFTTNNSYVSHMDSQHYTGEPLECSVCGKKFRHATNLRRHTYAVHNVKRYCCGICDKSFKSSGLLNIHQRVHSDAQPYACTQCPKRFKSRFARKTHELTHSGVLFKCTLCEKSYRYKSLLSMHMRKMHPEENTHNEEESI
ncbi:zinc finger protein with KRAB and SCAN domains 1-like [Anopheles arabiensis]|uniref:Uncharacterized protein n=1 Tax=Anopheles arabiensis TaxID=7173 RepID=A0A1I8JTF4_ANOAR|nr:zinc finger protein with KRAB and SCAN domains 1-like [Anopheles arabiensis]